jgi:hypothetical protein
MPVPQLYVRSPQRFLVFIQSISGLVVEFKGCGFWAVVVRFGGWGGGAIAFHKAHKMYRAGGTIKSTVQVALLYWCQYR